MRLHIAMILVFIMVVVTILGLAAAQVDNTTAFTLCILVYCAAFGAVQWLLREDAK